MSAELDYRIRSLESQSYLSRADQEELNSLLRQKNEVVTRNIKLYGWLSSDWWKDRIFVWGSGSAVVLLIVYYALAGQVGFSAAGSIINTSLGYLFSGFIGFIVLALLFAVFMSIVDVVSSITKYRKQFRLLNMSRKQFKRLIYARRCHLGKKTFEDIVREIHGDGEKKIDYLGWNWGSGPYNYDSKFRAVASKHGYDESMSCIDDYLNNPEFSKKVNRFSVRQKIKILLLFILKISTAVAACYWVYEIFPEHRNIAPVAAFLLAYFTFKWIVKLALLLVLASIALVMFYNPLTN